MESGEWQLLLEQYRNRDAWYYVFTLLALSFRRAPLRWLTASGGLLFVLLLLLNWGAHALFGSALIPVEMVQAMCDSGTIALLGSASSSRHVVDAVCAATGSGSLVL